MKHTPGPWKASKNGPWIVTDDETKMIAVGANTNSMCTFAAEVASFEDFTNRTIMAAAPELLEALHLIHGGLLNDSPNNPERQRKALCNIAVKAIQKAEGSHE